MIFFPLPRPLTKWSTLEVVRLNTATVNPWLSMFRTRFSPMTARPISPMSADGELMARLRLGATTALLYKRTQDRLAASRKGMRRGALLLAFRWRYADNRDV